MSSEVYGGQDPAGPEPLEAYAVKGTVGGVPFTLESCPPDTTWAVGVWAGGGHKFGAVVNGRGDAEALVRRLARMVRELAEAEAVADRARDAVREACELATRNATDARTAQEGS